MKINFTRLWNWGRLVLGLLGLSIVVYGVSEEDALLDTFLKVDLSLIFIAFGLTMASMIVKTYRWWLVLQKTPIGVSFQRLFGTYLVGAFFTQFMPGSSMGGDAIRMVETRADTGRTVTSISSVMVERAIGLMTVIVSASIILVVSPNEELTGTITYWTLHILSGIGVTGLIILRMGWFVEPTTRFLEKIKLGKVGSKIQTLSDALKGYLGETNLLLKMIVLSFLANAATMTAAYIALMSLGETPAYFAFIPLIALTVAIEVIPISPGSLGLKEATYVAFLTGILGVPHAASLATALLVRGINMAVGLIGGVVFVARFLDSSREKPIPPVASQQGG